MLTRKYYRMIARVIKNNTIINKDKKAFEQVRAARKLVDRRDREIIELRAEVEVLKSMIRARM